MGYADRPPSVGYSTVHRGGLPSALSRVLYSTPRRTPSNRQRTAALTVAVGVGGRGRPPSSGSVRARTTSARPRPSSRLPTARSASCRMCTAPASVRASRWHAMVCELSERPSAGSAVRALLLSLWPHRTRRSTVARCNGRNVPATLQHATRNTQHTTCAVESIAHRFTALRALLQRRTYAVRSERVDSACRSLKLAVVLLALGLVAVRVDALHTQQCQQRSHQRHTC